MRSLVQLIMVFFVVTAPPGATISPRSAHMAPGAQVEFRCDVTGSPRPRIQWSKEDGELPRRHSIVGSTLTSVICRNNNNNNNNNNNFKKIKKIFKKYNNNNSSQYMVSVCGAVIHGWHDGGGCRTQGAMEHQ